MTSASSASSSLCSLNMPHAAPVFFTYVTSKHPAHTGMDPCSGMVSRIQAFVSWSRPATQAPISSATHIGKP